MAFIRRKQMNGTTYYTLVESARENGQIQQKVIVSLGKCATIDAACRLESMWAEILKKRAEWGFAHKKNGRYVCIDQENNRLYTLPVGKPAQIRAEKCEKRIALLQHWRDVMSKKGHDK